MTAREPSVTLVLRDDDERGSIIMAMLIIMALSVSLIALLTTVEGGLNQSRVDQDRTTAFQEANAGVDHALHRLDRSGGQPTGSTGALPNVDVGSYRPRFTNIGGTDFLTGFDDSVAVAGVNYRILADVDPPPCPGTTGCTTPVPYQTARWKVRSIGTKTSDNVNRVRERQAVATLEATPLFLNGFFTLQDFYLTGNQDSPVAYHSSTDPGALIAIDPVPGSLGTNATIQGANATIVAFAARWQSFNMYGRATQAAADAACSNGDCGTYPKVNAITDALQVKTPVVPGNARPCPNGGVFTGTIVPGDYQCDDVTLIGTIVVDATFGAGNGTGRVRVWPTRTFNVPPGTVVNEAQIPAKFQVYFDLPGHALADNSSICGQGVGDTQIWALLYTPSLGVNCNGSGQPAIYGAVLANLHSGTGNHFDFHWDLDSQLSVTDGLFVVKDWRECPVSQTTC